MDPAFLARMASRSCNPTHRIVVVEENGVMQNKLEPLRDVDVGETITLMFDDGWKESDEPLECAEHGSCFISCPIENERRVAASARAQIGRKNPGVIVLCGLPCGDKALHRNSNDFLHSCTPDSVLRPYGHWPDGTETYVIIGSEKDALLATLPFDYNWKEFDYPLECERHKEDMSKCWMEQERKKAAEERAEAKKAEGSN